MSDNPEKPKLIIDEDWKSKVLAEKEAAQHAEPKPVKSEPGKPEPAKPEPAMPDVPSASQPTSAESERDVELGDLPDKLPRATFSSLVTMLATQAMVALGQFPDPVQNKPVVRVNFARHYIDILTLLDEKTRGNLAPDESGLLDHVLHDLRMAFIEVQKTRS